MKSKFHEDGTKIVLEVEGVRCVLRYVEHANCEGCALVSLCSMFYHYPCRLLSDGDNYVFIQESLLKKEVQNDS